MKEKIGKRVKQIRTEKHLTQESFGQIIGVTKQAVANIENAHSFPSFELTSKLYENFNINLNWFLTGNGDMFNKSAPQNEQLESLVAQIVNKELKKRGLE